MGLKLAAKGIGMVLGLDWLSLDGRLVAVVAGGIVLATSQRKRFPAALVIFVAGLAIFLVGRAEVLQGLSWGWAGPRLVLPNWAQWQTGILQGALPQVPLTLLNSVIAVCALSSDLYPGKGIGTRPMAVSVGLMNVGACLFGAMPACHGSGGLAGQHRFGARTGGSVVMLGIGKILIGAVFGGAAMIVLAAYPASILGILLVFAGLELTLPARDCVEREAFFVAAATAGGILAFNTWLGFILGLFAAVFILRGGKDSADSK
ncbi:MAG: putative sulfate/molybdate transporter [Elusimicrobiota bacterium]